MKNVALHNLGCKVNSYEMEIMQQMLQEKGYCIVPFDSIADIYIVNTCSVTNIADRKSRQMLNRAKAKNPDAVVVAVGCYVQSSMHSKQGTHASLNECIDLAVGNDQKSNLVAILEEYLLSKNNSQEEIYIKKQSNNPPDEMYKTLRKHPGTRTRAYIKIQDGCNQFCSYCIVPHLRGRSVSRRVSDIIEEIKGIVEKGCQEIVLTGIHISSYGIDRPSEPKLIDLIELIHEMPGIHRLRLGSLEPRIITEENVERLKKLDKLCPHFHLSMQSGCNEILKRMNRHYTTREYCQCVEMLRKAFNRPAITADVIVGFPGETEEDFEETYEFLREVKHYEMHVFKYSKRKGTKAAEMEEQLAESVKGARSRRLISLGKRYSREYREYYIGRWVEVLFEEKKIIKGKEYQIGHTADYVKVAVETGENLANVILTVKITGFLSDEILNSIFH